MQLQYTITLLTISLIMPLQSSYNKEETLYRQRKLHRIDYQRLLTSIMTPAYEAVYKNINSQDTEGNTQLHNAVMTDDYKKIDELLKTPGINCNIQNNYRMTALYIAAGKNKTEIVETLLTCKNINPHLRDIFNLSPLSITTSNQIRDKIEEHNKNNPSKLNHRYQDTNSK